jgi:hypothetical protein
MPPLLQVQYRLFIDSQDFLLILANEYYDAKHCEQAGKVYSAM